MVVGVGVVVVVVVVFVVAVVVVVGVSCAHNAEAHHVEARSVPKAALGAKHAGNRRAKATTEPRYVLLYLMMSSILVLFVMMLNKLMLYVLKLYKLML